MHGGGFRQLNEVSDGLLTPSQTPTHTFHHHHSSRSSRSSRNEGYINKLGMKRKIVDPKIELELRGNVLIKVDNVPVYILLMFFGFMIFPTTL